MAGGDMITVKIGDDEIGAWHEQAKSERIGGLVLVQEIFGITEHIREMCAMFAQEGYEVIAPSLFDRIEKNFQASYEPDGVKRAMAMAEKNGLDGVPADIQACIDLLKPPVFITGYCYGGSATWLAACRCRGLTAAAGYYGRLIIDYVDEKPKVPTILHFGEHDDTIPMKDVRAIEGSHPDVEVYVYPAGHSFNSARASHYDQQSAELALERTLAHFRANMP